MEALGGYRELAPVARLLGSLVFLSALAVAALLERLQFKLRASESKTWWASNGRDVVNVGALAATTLGLYGVGFTGPIALAIASTVVIVLSALQMSFQKHRGALGLSLGAALVLGLPVLLAPRGVDLAYRAMIEHLFG